MAQLDKFTKGRKPVTFVDLFAGAGGISEGFMQAYTDHNYDDSVNEPTEVWGVSLDSEADEGRRIVEDGRRRSICCL